MNNQPKSSLRQYLPLILVLLTIILLTIIKASMTHMWNMHYVATDFMGFFFLIFGLLKIVRWQAFAESYTNYDLIAQRNKYYGYAYPIIEISLGLAYLMRFQLPIVNIITLLLMIVSSLGVLHALRTQGTIMCACLGTFFAIPLTWVTLAEDLLMAVMALMMIFKVI